MKKRILSLALLLSLLMSVLYPAISYAEESNRGEVRTALAQGGWNVVYGDLINEADYAEFIAAVALAVATENPAPIYEYFDYQLQVQVRKITQSAPEIAQDALVDLLIRAFDSNGAVLRDGRLEISAGLATYNRWDTIVYDEPRTYTCSTGGVIKTEYPCVTMVRVEKRVPYPNNFQPYFRFRWTSGGQVSNSPNANQNPYAVVCIKNNTGWSINYKAKWGDNEWKEYNVDAHRNRWHSWTYAPGSKSSPAFRIRYDADFSSGTDFKVYVLERYQASTKTCDAGKTYTFEKVRTQYVELYSTDD